MKIAQLSSKIIPWIGNNSALFATITLFIFGGIYVNNFLTMQNFSGIFYQYAIIGFLALGQLLVILTAGIDLSQGSVVAFTSIVVALLMQKFGITIGVGGGLLAATFLGLINGIIVSTTNIPPFVVTLGMLGIARGLALVLSNAKPISIEIESFIDFGRSNIFGIPVSAILLVVAALLLAFFLRYRKTGRYIYAIGSSEESSRLSGIDVRKVKLLVYSASAFLTGIGAVIWTARLNSGSPIGANGYEMESIAAVIVGGGNLFGGVGTVFGTMLGILLFGMINSVLNLVGISPYWQGTIKGVLILMAVALSQIQRLRKNESVAK
jgi:ribose/xylose/arabinose/galactoside ABC-type transport system permease subunit